MRTVFVDLDGVLADCNGHYERSFRVTLPQHAHPIDDNIFWGTVMLYPGPPGQFFRELPLCDGALQLITGLRDYIVHEVAAGRSAPGLAILTGCPKGRPYVAEAKRKWVETYFGPQLRVITCPSADKYLHGKPGDVLIDDWEKWRERWESMGGKFVLHRNAEDSLLEVRRHLVSSR